MKLKKLKNGKKKDKRKVKRKDLKYEIKNM